MNTTPFAKKVIVPEVGSIEWMIEQARINGYVYADNRFLLWVDKTLGKPIGDLFRSCLVNTKQWMIRNGIPVGKIRLDDLINYVFIGFRRSADGKSEQDGFGRTLASIKKSPFFKTWFSNINSKFSAENSQLSFSTEGIEQPLNVGSVKSKNFNSWFNKSKVVDANGMPLKVYHGTGSDFSEFNDVSYFSADPDIASNTAIEVSYARELDARVIPVYLSIQNPSIMTTDEIEGLGYERWKIENLRAQGFDGAINPEMTEIVSFYSNQIKSAIGNNGNFDYENPDILLSSSANLTNTQAFKQWFGNSKAVDEYGSPLIIYHGTSDNFSTFGNVGENFPDSSIGYYFTTDQTSASEYAKNSASAYNGEGQNVMPVFLRIINPLVVQGSDWDIDDVSDQIRKDAIVNGHDGIIAEQDGKKTFIAFWPDQIKSATGNNGQFNPANQDIRFSRNLSDEIDQERIDAEMLAVTLGANDSKVKELDDPSLKSLIIKLRQKERIDNSRTVESVNESTNDEIQSEKSQNKFEQWFGESKVIDDQGKPKVVYHGTRDSFDIFRRGKSSRGQAIDAGGAIFFTSDPIAAEYHTTVQRGKTANSSNGANILPVYLKMDNPFIVDAGGGWKNADRVNEWKKYAKEDGNDGIIILNVNDAETGIPADVYIVFSPNQIKSAIGNNGQYDNSNPDIRFSRSFDVTETQSFKQWFNNSKVMDDHGTPLVVYHGTARTSITKFEGHRGSAGHFSFDPAMANEWAEARHLDEQEIIAAGDPDFGDAAVVYPVYLKAENIFDARNHEHLAKAGIEKVHDYEDLESLIDTIKSAGFDSYYDFEHNLERATGIAVFDQAQIKSATGNNGQFDPENPDIRFSRSFDAINTQSFKDWFNDSKVMDDHGKPLVVYHGTTAKFSTFDKGLLSSRTGDGAGKLGFYFSADEKVAKFFTSDGDDKSGIMSAYLSIENPYLITADSFEHELAGAEDFEAENFRSELEKKGFDGIIIRSGNSTFIDSAADTFIAFNPEQIKSATGNNGQFDPENPDIRFSRSFDAINTQSFKDWFNDSKVVDDHGKPLVVHHGTRHLFDEFEKNDNGLFFTGSMDTALAYARGYDDFEGTVVKSAYLSLVNPLVVDTTWLDKFSESAEAKARQGAQSTLTFKEAFEDSEKWARDLVIHQAKERGHDGLIIESDLSPEFHMGGDWNYQRSYVVFNPEQIKSTIGNIGQFDPENSDIRFSRSQDTTIAFKHWFDKSKVVDDHGNPMVVYHGTDQQFDKFDIKKAGMGNDRGMRGRGLYFSTNEKTAGSYGSNVMPVYVSIQNPFIPSIFQSKQEIAEHLGIDENTFEYNIGGEFKVYQPFSGTFTSAAKDAGYDGVIYPLRQEVIAFSPEQIKSAISKNGNFDDSNPDIRFSRADDVRENPSFKKWFSTSQVIDFNNKPLIVYHGTKTKFTQFNPGDEGIFFSESKETANFYKGEEKNGHLISAYLSIKNPLRITWREWLKGLTDNGINHYLLGITGLEQMGYDGVILSDPDVSDPSMSSVTYIVFHPEQIKSSTGNNGQFNPENPNIRFSCSKDATKTESFNHWFGESKAVDENGKPRVMYHGTASDFSVFNTGTGIREGLIYLSIYKELASDYAEFAKGDSPNVMPVYVKAENIFDPDKPEHLEMVMDYDPDAFDILYESGGCYESLEKTKDGASRVVATLKDLGFDGIMVRESPDEPSSVRDIAVFDSKQIKSAIGNNGQFNPENPDIRFSSSSNDSELKNSQQNTVDFHVKNKSTLTESALILEVAKTFPRLIPAVNTILDRGKKGMPGGAIIIDSDNSIEIANMLSERTGISAGYLFNNIICNGEVRGMYEGKTKTTFILGKNLSPEMGVAVLAHELTHNQQSDRIDDAAVSLLKNKDQQPESTRRFLERVESRISEARELGNKKEALAYIIELAILEHLTSPTREIVMEEGSSLSC